MRQDYVRSLGQMASGKIRFLSQFFRIPAINENGLATGGVAAIHVAPAVAHHPALRQINVQFARDVEQHAGLRLATIAIGQAFARMKTNFHAVNRQMRHHVRVDFLDDFPGKRAASNVRLIRGNHEQKTGGFQFGARGGNFGKNLKLRQVGRRIRLAIALQRAIDDAIAIKKYCAPNF